MPCKQPPGPALAGEATIRIRLLRHCSPLEFLKFFESARPRLSGALVRLPVQSLAAHGLELDSEAGV